MPVFRKLINGTCIVGVGGTAFTAYQYPELRKNPY